jgi:hypothetical protein
VLKDLDQKGMSYVQFTSLYFLFFPYKIHSADARHAKKINKWNKESKPITWKGDIQHYTTIPNTCTL